MSRFNLENCDAKLRKRIEEAMSNQVGGEISHTKQRECSPPLASDCETETYSPERAHVCFTLCRVKLLDVDAKYASVKDLLDGLTIASIIRGDKEGQITLEVNQVKVAHYKDEQTVIMIEEIE